MSYNGKHLTLSKVGVKESLEIADYISFNG